MNSVFNNDPIKSALAEETELHEPTEEQKATWEVEDARLRLALRISDPRHIRERPDWVKEQPA